MKLKKLSLLLSFLLLLSVYLFGFSDLQNQIIKNLGNDLTTVSSELTVLRSQRESYKQEIKNLSLNLKKKELSVQDYKKQVIILNDSIDSLNVIIQSKEKSLKESQAEILKLIEQSIGLNSDLLEAKKISIGLEKVSIKKDLQIRILKWGIVIISVIAGGELVYIIVDKM